MMILIRNYAVGLEVARGTQSNTQGVWPCKLPIDSLPPQLLAKSPKLIQAGYTTLDSIPRLNKRSGTRFYCPALKGVDSTTQDKVSKWIQLLHKHPAHLHALGIKDAQPQRDPGIQRLVGMTITKLTDKYIIKRNKIRNQITLLRGQTEEGVAFFLDK